MKNNQKNTDNEFFATKDQMISTLEKLNERNKTFFQYKLTVDYNLDKFIQLIKKTQDSHIAIVENALTPYIEGIE